MVKVLFFTPTQPKRMNDPWLEPVRESHRKVQGTYERLIHVDNSPRFGSLPEAYNECLDYALRKRHRWILAIEDDEEPTRNILKKFLAVAEQFPEDGFFMGVKMLRQCSVTVPLIWDFGMPSEVAPIGARILRCQELVKMANVATPILGGTLCTPMLISPEWFKKHSLRFRPHPQNRVWDSCLGDDLYAKRLRYIGIPYIRVKHWDQETRRVFCS